MGGFRLSVLVAAAVLLSGLAAMLPMALGGADALEESCRDYAARDMRANATILALAAGQAYAAGDTATLVRLVHDAKSDGASRYTIIGRDGRVLADSNEDAARMENHANRPEVREALAGRRGMDTRQSSTLGTEWIYVAVPLGDGVARAAESLDEVGRRLDQWWREAVTGAGIAIVVLLAFALVVARVLAKPMEAAAAGAERFARGEFQFRLPIRGSAETRRVSTSLNTMAEELDTRIELILRQREEMRAVFANMSEGVIAVDPNSRIMLLNRAAERMLDVTEDVAGKAIELAIRNPDLLDALRAGARNGEPVEREVRVPSALGGDSLLQVGVVAIREGEKELGVLAVMRDVTRLRQLEAVRRDFVANVSHELRTPVATVQSSLEALRDEGLDDKEKASGFLDMALRNTRRLGAIIGNMLLLAGMETGKGKNGGGLIVAALLRPVLEEALEMSRDSAEARGAKFDLTCPEDLAARMNPRLIVQAVVNLLDNAVKYGPEGGTVSVTAVREGRSAKITVSDHGPGISPKYQSRVFERFYRIDGSTRLREGAGLGLALVKHIALAQGGDIKLESHIGVGSSFMLYLPLAE